MNLNTCNIIQRIEQVLAELDNSAIEEYVIVIIIIIIIWGSCVIFFEYVTLISVTHTE